MMQLNTTMKRTNVQKRKADVYANEHYVDGDGDDDGRRRQQQQQHQDDGDDDDKTLHLNQRQRQEKRLPTPVDGERMRSSSIHRSAHTQSGGDGNRDENSSVRTMMMTKNNSKRNMNNLTQLSIEDQEDVVRSMQIRNPLILTILGFYAACKVMVFYLINVETLVACGISGGMTVYWYNYGTYQTEVLGNEWNGGGMDYVILAFAVTSPIAAAIGMAFTRRERALFEIADFQSFAHQLYMAHSLWDWEHSDADNNNRGDDDGGGGHGGRTVVTTRTNQTMMTNKSAHDGTIFDFHIDRSKLRLKHSDAVLTQLIGIGDEMARFLSLPTQNRSIHRMTRPGKRQAAETVQVAYRLLHSMTSHRLTRLAVYGERIKKAGLPSGEVSRIRQYERFLEDNVKRLRMIKAYRTPQAFRSFARLFTIFLPPFYAPTYAQVAIDTHSLGLGVAFGIVTALALTALFESLQVLEDPFVAQLKLDGIDCREEFQVLLWNSLVNTRRSIFPNAPPYPEGRRKALDFDKVHANTGERDDVPTNIPSHAPKPSRTTSVASLNTTTGPDGVDGRGSYTRIFDVAGASRYPHSLHAYDLGSLHQEEQQKSENEKEEWIYSGKDDDERNEGIYQTQRVRNDIHPPPVVVTRSDSLEFGDPWDDDDLDFDLDSFTINGGDPEEGKGVVVVGGGGGGGGGANSVGVDIDLQLQGMGDNLVDGRIPYSAPASVAASSVAMSQHTNVGVRPAGSKGGGGGGTQHNLHRRIKSTASDSIANNIGVRESDYERDRVRPLSPPPSPSKINKNNNMSRHHDRARAKTATSIPSKAYDRPGSPSLG